MPDEYGHPPVIPLVNMDKDALAAGPTVYPDMLFDHLGVNANFCTAEKHDGGDTAPLEGTAILFC